MRAFLLDLIRRATGTAALARQVAALEEKLLLQLGRTEAALPSPARGAPKYPVNQDLFRAEVKEATDERTFTDRGCGFTVKSSGEGVQFPHVNFTVRRDRDGVEKTVFLPYSHKALSRLLTRYAFNDVLDIGSRDGASAQIFEFCGKHVDTVEISGNFQSKYQGDFSKIEFDRQFDCLWCSHVLEHQRNVGCFLDKMFEATKEGGLIAISVPCAISPILLGHPSIFTPAHLIYHLVCAGFDCRNAEFRIYDWQLSLILRKVTSKAPRTPIGMYPSGEFGSYEGMFDLFPPIIGEKLRAEQAAWGEIESLNWPA